MKRISIVLAILTSCCLAQQDPFVDGRGPGSHGEHDPFGDHGPPKDAGPHIPAPNIRAFLQYIEVSHSDLTTLLADAPSGDALHTKTLKMAEKQTARIVDSALFTFQSGEKTTAESVREFIYPTDQEPIEFGTYVLPKDPPSFPVIPPIRLLAAPNWIYWDTRNAGLTFEFDSPIILFFDDPAVTLRLLSEDVSCSGMISWMDKGDCWGDDSLRMPLFESRRAIQELTLRPGVWEMAAVLDPLPRPPAPALATKVLLFVRCEVP